MGWQLRKVGGLAAALLAPAAFADAVSSTKAATGVDQLEVQLNAGGIGYTGELGGLTGTGPSYGVSAGGYLTRVFGAEVGYDGSVNGVVRETVGGNPNAALWRHDIFTLAKAGVPFELGPGAIRPYAGVGLGGSYVNANNQAEGAYNNDWMGEVPVALGADYNLGALNLGVRGTYRALFSDGFARPQNGGVQPSGGLLGGQFTAGARF